MGSKTGNRMMFVDGMRGIAALAVVFYHLRMVVTEHSSAEWMPYLVELFFSYGYLGVDMFFVISGFVISYSLYNKKLVPSLIFNFGLRRSIRLDPPYWLTICVELLIIQIGIVLFPSMNMEMPELEKVLVHLIYMQDLLGYGNIVGIFWTLCYEVQFYLVYVTALVIFAGMAARVGPDVSWKLKVAVSSILFIVSIIIFFTDVENIVKGLFIDRWYQFMLGSLAMGCYLSGKLNRGFLLASIIIFVFSLIFMDTGADNGLTALITAWLFVIAVQKKKMGVWLSQAVFQFLGRSSYSLYLLHTVVGWRFIRLAREIYGENFSYIESWLIFFSGVFVSVFSAWLMYKLIEKPSLALSHKIRFSG